MIKMSLIQHVIDEFGEFDLQELLLLREQLDKVIAVQKRREEE